MVAEDEMSRQESVHKWLDSIAQSRCVRFRAGACATYSLCNDEDSEFTLAAYMYHFFATVLAKIAF